MLRFLTSFFFEENPEPPPEDFNLPDGVAIDKETMRRLKLNGNRQLFSSADIQVIREKLPRDQTEKPHYFNKSFFYDDERLSDHALDIVQIKDQIFALPETYFAEKPTCYFKFIQILNEEAFYGTWFLCKTMVVPTRKIEKTSELVEREVSFLKKSNQLIGNNYFRSRNNKSEEEFSFIMRIIDGIDLHYAYNLYEHNWPMLMWFDIYLAVLKEIQRLQFLHNDIKLANFILNLCRHLDNSVVAIDFAYSSDFAEAGKPLDQMLGTQGYVAPELFLMVNSTQRHGFTLQSNIFALAILGLTILFARDYDQPYLRAVDPETAAKLTCIQRYFTVLDTAPELEQIGAQLKILLTKMKDPKPEKRPSDFSEIIAGFETARTRYIEVRPGEVQLVNKICKNEKNRKEKRLQEIYDRLGDEKPLSITHSGVGFFSEKQMKKDKQLATKIYSLAI